MTSFRFLSGWVAPTLLEEFLLHLLIRNAPYSIDFWFTFRLFLALFSLDSATMLSHPEYLCVYE